MYFSKIELRQDTDTATRIARLIKDGYRLHQSLWELFKSDAVPQRDFLYRRVTERNWPCFYVVSARRPEDKAGLWHIQIKDYAPRLLVGQRLAFSLHANPVVTRRSDNGKAVRHDVVMDAKRRSGDKSALELIQTVGVKWLSSRGEKYGFSVDQQRIRVDSYQQHRFYKAKSGKLIRFSTLDFDGVLTVTDPMHLESALYNGIGPAKSFGCGLLLARRI